jgi:hypothetical protein
MLSLDKFLSKIKASEPLLPGTHVCDVVALSAILAQNELRPTPCDVFAENLVYVFYGRPAFRPKSSTHGTSFYHSFPTCMIFDLKELGAAPKRVYPFDTGAFSGDRYKTVLNTGLKRDDFLLEPSLDSAGRIVSHYFGSNGAYFRGQSGPAVSLDDPIHVEALGNLYASYGKRTDSPYDDRCLTVELQYDGSISLLSPVLRHIIAPFSFCKKAEVLNFVKSGGTVAGYGSHHGTAAECHAIVNLYCEQYLLGKGLIDAQ